MKSKAIILMIFLPVIAVSFVTPKRAARQYPRIKDTTGVTPPVSVRERFLGTWELLSTEYRYTDGTRRPYPDVGPHGKGCDDSSPGCSLVAGLRWLQAAAALCLF
jgi:hypothetical protein